MLEKLERTLKEYQMLPKYGTVVCAVSGGADSLCLLMALYQLRSKLGFSLAAAHYNHQLRGEESQRDEDFVRQFVRQHCSSQHQPDGQTFPDVPLYVERGDILDEAERRGTGVEETARSMRYDFLYRIADELGAAQIATAHTADDNAETILFHLARGTGLRGLTGIPPVRGNVIRPLLTITRQEVEEALEQWGLSHVEDSTNMSDDYARNRIRHHVTPVLENLYPGFSVRMAETAARLRQDEAYLMCLAEERLTQVEEITEGLLIPAQAIGSAPDPLAVRMVRQLIGRLRGGDQNCGAKHLQSVLRLCRGTLPSGILTLPGGIVVRREYEILRLEMEKHKEPMPSGSMSLPGVLYTGEWRIDATQIQYEGERQGPYLFYLCSEGMSQLEIRSRQSGDWLKLPGRPRKSVKKWLVEEKIPRYRREQLPVFLAGERIAAVAGLGPDNSFVPQPGQWAWRMMLTPISWGEKTGREIIMMENDIQEVLFTEEQLKTRVQELARMIEQDYEGKEIMLIGVLRGSFIFIADLCRAINLPCTLDFMAVSSYGKGIKSNGQVQITKDLTEDILGRHVIVVEDILDSGNTLSYLLKMLENRGPASIRLCTLLNKPECRVKPVDVHYSGFNIPDAFVVGYGLDYAEKYRNLPYIGILKPEVYSK